MHLPDGVVPVEFALAGYGASAAICALCLRRIAAQRDPAAAIPRAAMLTAAFFAATLVAIPVPPVSVHMVLSGLMGVMLGWFAFPAILVGLFLQAVMFGHGGLTSLGLNGVIIGLPALLAGGLYRLAGARMPAVAAAGAGAGAVAVALALFAAILLAGLPTQIDAGAERVALAAMAVAHLPLMLAEGAIVLAVLAVLRRVEPGMLPRV
jgi:cobalt/nickel transport system permease protein